MSDDQPAELAARFEQALALLERGNTIRVSVLDLHSATREDLEELLVAATWAYARLTRQTPRGVADTLFTSMPDDERWLLLLPLLEPVGLR